MTDRPILFSGPMIRALLAGTKTQTRRLFKAIEQQSNGNWHIFGGIVDVAEEDVSHLAPEYTRIQTGDRLWVRETYSGHYHMNGIPPRDWRADLPIWLWADGNPDNGDWTKPKPGMHMPRWASRLTLTVTNVRVERLQDISEVDAIDEGIERSDRFPDRFMTPAGDYAVPVVAYQRLWESINGPGSWDANPWVAAYTFTVHRQNIDAMSKEAA